jgi:hypothetical protein
MAFNVLWYTTAYKRALVKDEISNELINKIRYVSLSGFSGLFSITINQAEKVLPGKIIF